MLEMMRKKRFTTPTDGRNDGGDDDDDNDDDGDKNEYEMTFSSAPSEVKPRPTTSSGSQTEQFTTTSSGSQTQQRQTANQSSQTPLQQPRTATQGSQTAFSKLLSPQIDDSKEVVDAMNAMLNIIEDNNNTSSKNNKYRQEYLKTLQQKKENSGTQKNHIEKILPQKPERDTQSLLDINDDGPTDTPKSTVSQKRKAEQAFDIPAKKQNFNAPEIVSQKRKARQAFDTPAKRQKLMTYENLGRSKEEIINDISNLISKGYRLERHNFINLRFKKKEELLSIASRLISQYDGDNDTPYIQQAYERTEEKVLSHREVQEEIIRLRDKLQLPKKMYQANKEAKQNLETLRQLRELEKANKGAKGNSTSIKHTTSPNRKDKPQKKMKGGALYSQKPNARWYGNSQSSQDKFTPFGTKLIQAEQFQNDNIVCLYHNCGTRDKNFPVRKVNADFASVLRDMLNGKAPNYNTMNKLSDDDKVYLNKIIRKTKQHGYYSVPMPEKDDETKHHERLEWCLGQIRAGNNSPDIVKELKTKLLWFRNNGLMPRSQINEVLYELNDLGY